MIVRRLSSIAREINQELEGFTAEIVTGYCNTDQKISGTRLIRPGKGRTGNKLIVRNADGNVVLAHNAADTYRHNGEVEAWLDKVKAVIADTGPTLQFHCPTCRIKMRSAGDYPFHQCIRCKKRYLATGAHYGREVY